MNKLLLLILPLLLSGCVNNFEKFYTSARLSPNVTLCPYSGSTEISNSNDLSGDAVRLRENGYWPLGVASFETGGRITIDQMRDRAKEIGADFVLWSDKYLGTQESAMLLPDVSTTNTFGNVGGTSFNASSSTFSTTVVPYSIRRYAWTATFWRKAQSYVFGAFVVDLPNDLRQELQRNSGVLTKIVVVESPAFKANILPGDVIIKVNDQDVYSPIEFTHVITMDRGTACVVTVIRGGVAKSVPVTLNP